MNEEEQLRKDILFQIDMQLYDKFNDKFCEMNDNLGTIYTYKDIDDLIKLEKETEIKLLRKAIEKQQKEIEARLEEIDSLYKMMSAKDERIEHLTELVNKYNDMQYIRKIEELYISKDKIKEKLEEIENSDTISIKGLIDFLEDLLGETND